MKVKFVSKLNKMSEIVFLVLSKKSALKNIDLDDKHIKEITKSIVNKGFGFKLNEIIEINSIKDRKLKTVYICGLGNKTKDLSALDFEKIGGRITELTKLKTRHSHTPAQSAWSQLMSGLFNETCAHSMRDAKKRARAHTQKKRQEDMHTDTHSVYKRAKKHTHTPRQTTGQCIFLTNI